MDHNGNMHGPPSSPRTPKRQAQQQHVMDSMVLRSGRTPGRTPLRMHTQTPPMHLTARSKAPNSGSSSVGTGLTPRHGDDEAFNLAFNDACDGILGNLDDMCQTAPGIIEGIMALDTEFGLTSPDGQYFPMSPALPKMCGEASHPTDQGYQFTGSSLSPLLANRLLSPKTFLDLSRRVRRTGLTPIRGQPSPKFGPYPSPSPYRLRSQNNSPAGFTPKFQDLAFSPDLMFGMREVTSKRQLIADVEKQSPPVRRTSPRKRMSLDGENKMGSQTPPMAGVATAFAAGGMDPTSSQKKRAKKDKKDRKDNRTTSAPKRGEYRCGKCGFFPKKAKHSCVMEKSKRAPGGPSLAIVPTENEENGHSHKQMTAADPMLSFLNVPHPHW